MKGSLTKAWPGWSTIGEFWTPERPPGRTTERRKPQRAGCNRNQNPQVNHFALGRIALTAMLGWSLMATSLAQTPPAAPSEQALKTTLPEASAESVVLPQSVPDPLEPLNRVLWDFNEGLMTGVIKPTKIGRASCRER